MLHNPNLKSNRPRVIAGRSLAHMRLTVRQRAVLAAQITLGEVHVDLTASQTARLTGVSVPYAHTMLRYSPEKRAAIMGGTKLPKAAPPKPKTIINFALPLVIDDAYLADLIHKVGVDRVLNVACTVEKQVVVPPRRPSLQEGWLKAHPQYAYTAEQTA